MNRSTSSWLASSFAEAFAASPDAVLARAQFESLSRQVPILHWSLIANTALAALAFMPLAPSHLTFWFPGALILFCMARVVKWWREPSQTIDDATIRRRLRSSTALAAVLGVAFAAWAISLFPYGGPYESSQLAFYMAATVLGCTLCLTHQPATVLALFLTNVAPCAIFFMTTGTPSFASMGLNTLIVTVTMSIVTVRYYGDFVDLVHAKRDLTARQNETQRLSDENFRLANIDALTGLPNRRSFFDALEQILAEANRKNGREIGRAHV